MTKTKTAAPTSVTVRYDLRDLHTAQHKAGLAGLLLQVESMRDRKLPVESVPRLTLEDATTLTAVLTPASLIGLFDDLYDARLERAESPTRWPGATVIDEVEKPDRSGKPRKMFVYEVVEPRGNFFRRFTDGVNEPWHKLWRNMLWAIPRGKPTTRGPFNARAAGQSSGEGEAAWKELLALTKAAAKGESVACEIGSALLLGAQAASAESVPFRDRVDHALLLHFWPLTTRIFVPEQVDSDGNREFTGYVLAVPEVANLSLFAEQYKRSLGELDPKLSGYRPAAAVVSLPAQGALELMDTLARLTATAAGDLDYNPLARSLVSVDYFHLDKRGNNVKAMSQGRLAVDRKLLNQYRILRKLCRNPLYRQGRLIALVKGRPWHEPFGDFFAQRPAGLFVNDDTTPRHLPSFGWDVLTQFNTTLDNEKRRKDQAMSSDLPPPASSLETIVFRLVQNYVRLKTEQKSGCTYDSFKDSRSTDDKGRSRVNYPKEYLEAQERVCQDLFLGLRSRRDDDFVSYFTGTVNAFPQRKALPSQADYVVVAKALMDDEQRTHVKTLAMLAVSAASYARNNRDNQDDEPKENQ